MANVLETSMNFLQTQDPEIAACIENEFHRQKQNIELIASENIASPAVIAAMGSVLTNKYAEGYPGKRYYGGCDYVDVLENIAMERAKALFGAAYANVQPHSGAQANLEVYAALLQPGDTLMGMDLASGGHLTHGARVNLSGKYYNSISYGVDPKTGRIDYDQVEDLVRRYHPKLLVAGASAYPRAIDFKIFADIAHRSGALLMVDMAHIAGLVAGGGMILSRDEQFAKKLNSAVFPGTQGGPLMHVIAGKAVCLREAAQPAFKVYAENVVKNAKALAAALLERGFDLVTGGTDNHLMLADLRKKNITGKDLQIKLDEVHITVNKNAIPNDPQKPGVTSGVRIGTPACTTRGFTEEDMPVVADCIDKIATDYDANREAVLAAVAALVKKHPIYE